MRKLLMLPLFLLTIQVFAEKNIDTNFIQSPIVLETPTGNIFGTLTTPLNFSKGPVVLIIAGSGPTDRNGNNPMMKNNSLQQLAFGLADAGIASLRYDKRGIAASAKAMHEEAELRFDNYFNDAKDWVSLLKKDSRFNQIIIAGHSEGSLLGMIAATKNVSKYISIAGPGNKADETIREQLENQPDAIKELAFPILDSLSAGITVSDPDPMLAALFRPSVQPYLISWFKYNPQIEITKLSIPILIIQGDNDIQVSVKDAELLSSAKKDAQINIIKGMNHILEMVPYDDKEANIKSYSNPKLPLAEELLNTIISFIKK